MVSILRALLAAAIAVAVMPQFAAAQSAYPNKSITLMVPAAAGGPTDTVARLIAESMGRTLGQTIVVENVGGAGGTIGLTRLAKAAPDGYTVAVWHIAMATAPALYDNLTFNVTDDFDTIGRITDAPMSLVTKTGVAAKDVKELIAWIKAESGKVTYGHAGIGSASHLCALLLMKEMNVQMVGVGYRGTGPAMNDLLSGQFDFMCDQTTNTTNQIKEKRIQGYAVTTKTKVSSLPDLPTLDSGALPGFEISAWHAMWAPKGLPKEATDKLVAALQAALKDPKVIQRFADLGAEPVPQNLATPEALKSQLASEVKRWDTVIKASGVKAN
ncbi:tripartite tricarboxylate transporter substrate binding protein BugD [Bradyrhizobium lablabi]|uniref:tripartite tricarboxylate transporter substrate-binding protein n=1 Tax=Bradyrhizobium lablabi TaxID=722472 RepID=UPI001BA8A5C0|nr:tripartite tricarboxylate transporter substrate-binding protein [Bradyrhizobium lablabi]MBR1125867.1 tripartite tricarboxylate transporter substrate binding protein BugD [Bradyrhizobium lablabi]